MEPRADRRSSGWRATSRNMSGASSDAAGGDGPGLRPEDLGAWGRLSADAEFNAKGEAKGPGGVMWGALHSAGFGAPCDALGSVPDARRRRLARPSRVRPMLETAATAARGAVRSGSATRSAAFPPPKCRRASSSRCGHGYKSVPYRRANSIRDPPQQRVRAPFATRSRRCAVRASTRPREVAVRSRLQVRAFPPRGLGPRRRSNECGLLFATRRGDARSERVDGR